MDPEVLIVGDEGRLAPFRGRVVGLGYRAACVTPEAVTGRLADGSPPSVIVVGIDDSDPAVLMAAVRRTRHGAAIPVILLGELGEEIQDLADVLDLGADHFLEASAPDAQLQAALEELAGPAGPPAPDTAPDHTHTFDAWPSKTEIIDEPSSSGSLPGVDQSGSARQNDPVIGQLHRTLDILEERLRRRDRDAPPAPLEPDDVDLAALGLDGVPDVEDGGELIDPGDSHDRMEVARVAGEHNPGTVRLPPRRGDGRPDSTVRIAQARALAQASAASEVEQTSPAARELETRLARPDIADRPRRSIPLPVERTGPIATLEVPRLLWKLHRAHFSGTVALRRGRVEKRIWMDNGNVVFAASNRGHDRLIDGLLRRGLLTRTQYDTARRLAAKEPRRAGQLLVEAGFVKPQELHRVLRTHLIRIVDSTFPWNEGAWSLEPGVTCDEPVVLQDPTPRIIMEGIRHRMEPTQLMGLIGGPSQHPRFLSETVVGTGGLAALVDQLLLNPSEEALFGQLDGRRSLDALLLEPDVDELEMLALVYALHVLELVELVGEAPPPPSPGVDPAEVDRRRVRDRLRMARESDYFALLGLRRDATRVDVRRAYRELALTFADDRLEAHTVRDLAAELDELRAALVEAHDILADDTMRCAYLAHLEDP